MRDNSVDAGNDASRSLKDLLEVRDQYHLHSMNKAQVVGTAIAPSQDLETREGDSGTVWHLASPDEGSLALPLACQGLARPKGIAAAVKTLRQLYMTVP